ncbi:hypothetical protein [Aquicoccus sp.]|uniref:hypothetical protein n=1 Tax=Aquicoccus sp. TaxID=2055851 RepID=UPI0035649D92
MDVDLQWLVRLGVTIALGGLTILSGTFWRMMAVVRSVEKQAKDDDRDLHKCVDKVQDEAVKKSDMDSLVGRLSGDVHEIRDEFRRANDATNLRLDALLNAIANRNNNHKGGSND